MYQRVSIRKKYEAVVELLLEFFVELEFLFLFELETEMYSTYFKFFNQKDD